MEIFPGCALKAVMTEWRWKNIILHRNFLYRDFNGKCGRETFFCQDGIIER